MVALTFLGGLPFLAAAAGRIGHFAIGPLTPDMLALSYATAIASFLAGLHWGLFFRETPPPTVLLVSSNVICLAAWAVLVFHAQIGHVAYWVDVTAFLLLLAIDIYLGSRGVLTSAFIRMRALITAIVVVSLFIVGSGV
jgi:hypothetical protein